MEEGGGGKRLSQTEHMRQMLEETLYREQRMYSSRRIISQMWKSKCQGFSILPKMDGK